jgi:glycosyltransferase involved in cell wall biosynthesis
VIEAFEYEKSAQSRADRAPSPNGHSVRRARVATAENALSKNGHTARRRSATGTIRTLLIASERPPLKSGVAEAIKKLSAGLRGRGHIVDVLAGTDARSLTIGEFRFNSLASKWAMIGRTLAAYDIVNVHGPAPTISDAYLMLLRTVPRARRPRVVYTHHFCLDLPNWTRLSRVYDRMHRLLASTADQIVVTSESYQSIMATRHGPPVDVIPWGVDVERFRGRRTPAAFDGSRPLRLLFVGQMREYKGLPQLLMAAAGQPALDLTLVGSGPLERNYRQLATEPNVTFIGRVPDDLLTELYLEHDVVVMPSTSRLEAFGLALLEGMAGGCVPVASDLPGVRDVASATGRIVRTGDVADLRNTLLALAADPAVVRELQQRSRSRAMQYTWAATVAAYEGYFRNGAMQTNGAVGHHP